MARNDKVYAARLRKWFASSFGVSAGKVNLERAFKYLNYLNSPEQRNEQFLDRLADERREFEEREAERIRRTVSTRYAE